MKCTGVNRQWHDTRWRNPAEEHGQHVDHNDVSRFRTDVFLTPRHVTCTGSLGGTCWNSPHCGRTSSALVYGAQNTGLPPDHVPILLTLRYILQPQRGEAPTARAGIRWDLQAVAVDRPFEKAKPRFEALREDPTPDAHWALWVDFVRETAQTFFSLHRTSRKDDAQKETVGTALQTGFRTSIPHRTDGKVLGDVRAVGRLL